MSPPITGHAPRGTEEHVWRVARALRDGGHHVNVVTAEQRDYQVEGIYWWPSDYFPHRCDVLIACERIDQSSDFEFERLLVPLNRLDPTLAGKESTVSKFVCLSENHVEVLLRRNPTIKPEQTCIVMNGVDVPKRRAKVDGRVIWCNSPDRGLVHLIRTWPLLLERAPQATLDITYDFANYHAALRYVADYEAEKTYEIAEAIAKTPSITAHPGDLTHEQVVALQSQAEVYAYPCESPMPQGLFTCFAAFEAAAAGNVLLLTETDGFPSVFGEVGEFIANPTDYELWADTLASLLKDKAVLKADGERNRLWAKAHPWSKHASEWRHLVKDVMK